MKIKEITLSHGSGGAAMHELIRALLLKKLNNPILKKLSDSALLDFKQRLAFTTDSFVVSPINFPGGDIGKLAVCGTINDLVVSGAEPKYLSLALIMEEGFPYKQLENIVESIAKAAHASKVKIVTGDLKVVEKGACDKIFINTSGIGKIIRNSFLSERNIKPGDKIILTGNIASHGLAVLTKRKELDFGFNIKSDCAALNQLIIPILKKTNAIKFMRDPTRGGVATTLNEIAEASGQGIVIEEKKIPVSAKVNAACELLGMDPLYLANEGIAIMIVRGDFANNVVKLLRKNSLGRNSRIVGEVVKSPKSKVILNTVIGTRRLLDMLSGEQFPRIC